MKTTKLYTIGLLAFMIFTFSQQSFAQIVDFYSSPGYSALINNLIDNYIWNSSMSKYTKQNNQGGSGASKSTPSRESSPPIVPEYRRYPVVQFKPNGTSILLEQALADPENTPQDVAEMKKVIPKILKEYETSAAAIGYPNDWALAYVSFIGLSRHVYHGKTEKPIVHLYQNEAWRDIVAKYVTDIEFFQNMTDRKKQEVYENLVFLGGMAYLQYEEALREKNPEKIKAAKLFAERNLKMFKVDP